MREYQIRRLGDLRANRDENEVREALDRLERSASLFENDNNNENGTNNINNGKKAMATLGGGGGRRLPPVGEIIARIY